MVLISLYSPHIIMTSVVSGGLKALEIWGAASKNSGFSGFERL